MYSISSVFIQSFVSVQLPSSTKQAIVSSYILSVFVVWLDRSHGVLLLSVEIQCNLTETEILVIEWIALLMTVECTITYESYDNTRGQLSEEQFFVANIQVILWYGERLAHHTPYHIRVRLAGNLVVKTVAVAEAEVVAWR